MTSKVYKTLFFLFGLALIPFHSCTTSYKMSDNQKSSGHFRLYSFPEKRNIKEEKISKDIFNSMKQTIIDSSSLGNFKSINNICTPIKPDSASRG